MFIWGEEEIAKFVRETIDADLKAHFNLESRKHTYRHKNKNTSYLGPRDESVQTSVTGGIAHKSIIMNEFYEIWACIRLRAV